MTFRLVNLRGHEYNSEDLKKMIINITKSQYEQKAVKKEFTGKRPSFLKDKLNFLNIKKYTNVFLISALGRINSDITYSSAFNTFSNNSNRPEKSAPSFFLSTINSVANKK